MADTVTGSLSFGINLTTSFGTGTAGSAIETNRIETGLISIDANQAAGRAFTKVWSKRYTALAAPVTIDLTALTGVNGGTIDFTSTGLRLIMGINCDPTAGRPVNLAPGASNGFAAWISGTTPSKDIASGMPGAGVTTSGTSTTNYVGNPFIDVKAASAAYTIDSTHKTLTITPTGTVTDFVLILAA